MRPFLFFAGGLFAFSLQAQYGTFDAKAVQSAKSTTTLVVLDNGDSPYNRAIMEAVKANWRFTGGYDFIRVNDLATRPITPETTYLFKTRKSDPEKHDAIFLTLAAGWKQKKGEALQAEGNAVTNLPASQELAFLMIDPEALEAQGTGAFLNVYVKCLHDYLKQVETGKVIDKATADRLYGSRNRLLRDDLELWMAKGDLDKSLPDAAAAKAHYTHGLQVMDASQLAMAASEGKGGVAISDVVLTGDHKTKHCFKRVFNASTGELMYLHDDAALYGKKEGFIDEDLKTIERAR